MENFTIHIFGYGETQINSTDFSIKVKTDTLTKTTALIGAIWAKKPADSEATQDFHAVNVFGFNDIRWMSKNKGFSIGNDTELKPFIEAVIAELKDKFDALPKP